jgi:hypothetical protein
VRLALLFSLALLVAQPPVPTQTPVPTSAPPAQPAAAPIENPGILVVQVDPPASLYVDTKLVTATAAEHRIDLEGGKLHRVRLIHPDYLDFVRTLRIEPGQATTLVVSLPEKGVRKPPPAPARGGRAAATGRGAAGRGATAGRGAAPTQPLVTDEGLIKGIEFVKEGDFSPAVDTLYAVASDLSGVPRMIGQQALAYFYLGVATLELDRPDYAKLAFAMAQRADRTLAPKPTEFSKQVLAAWEQAKAMPATGEMELPNPVATAVPEPDASADTKAPTGGGGLNPVDPDTEFIEASGNAFIFHFAVPTAGRPCSGTLTVDKDEQSVSWEPLANGCTPAFTARFEELRSPAAAPRGGILLQFRSERPSLTVMPEPDADLLDPETEKMTINDLPPATRVHLRRTQKYLYQALGRPWIDSIINLLVDVPLAELLENPSDYDGGTIRTSGKLATTNPSRGPYTLMDEGATLQIVPTGSTPALLRSKGTEFVGKEIFVTGTFTRPAITANAPRGAATAPRPSYVISATKIEAELKYTGAARQVTLEELLKTPPRSRDQVRVIGKFRGGNYYGDLPIASRRQAGDWVIKDQVFAVWITGKAPQGQGFALDGSSQRDLTSYWVAVTGTVEERRGMVYLKADKVELSNPPSDTATVDTKRTLSGAARIRPDITFTAPNEGTEEMGRDQQILVQFTKPMEEASFAGHVQLRYADGSKVAFPYLQVTYYRDRNASVIIDPGSALLPGKTLECVLLPGIKDIDNQLLVGTEGPGGRVLKWKVRSTR